jgi:hypothetical protein
MQGLSLLRVGDEMVEGRVRGGRGLCGGAFCGLTMLIPANITKSTGYLGLYFSLHCSSIE